MKATLAGEHLAKTYGARQVVRDVNIEITQGEIVGLLGPNGAGKTTSFYMLTGIIKATQGRILYNGEDITSWALYKRARVGISYLPQESSVFKSLTVKENIQIVMEYTKLSQKAREEKIYSLLDEFGLTRLEKSLASYLSGGERRRLEIARCLVHDPLFVLLDEPFAGIDPLAVGDIQDLIKRLKNRGIGVLISDHNVRETLSICDRASIMYDGILLLSGTPEEIVNNEKAREIYLGENFYMQ
ncbi:LPS export ABC transporter ATP-binding protein [Taurinivorans muris]|uniref:Lipopolysaccharide export system ATP-binding protein LptB n=1 Tax=Taurinivorans muris TaxID=2787751 RepID=A0ABY5XZP5_9BACT|nr:LPS export ABC transporter ATP-binding protein [Desulfovibrionaceae bacterium LT0009]